ncbi:uncharacterized protein LOC134066305 isoform X2 [Sardina pilchardus]
MEGHRIGRFTIILASMAIYIVAIVLNILAGPGFSPFTNSTGNISAKYDTDITPSGWTFSIWIVIYIWLTFMMVYILCTLCLRNSYGYTYCSPPVLPYGFFISFIVNMICNITWLLLWDREQMIAALVIIALVALTNYIMIFFSCHGLKIYGAWLNKYHKRDLWLIRILVQNGIATYMTWTTLATLINLAIVMDYDGQLSRADAGTVCLSFLTVLMILWFILENSVLDKYVRYILTIYPVIIVALTGNITKNYDPAAPSRNAIFIAVLLGLACLLFVLRVLLVVWRHFKQPLYRGMNTEEIMSPIEIAEKQKKIFT